MRTKDPKYIPADYSLVSRLSIQRDFHNASFRKQGHEARPQEQKATRKNNVKRVLALSETSGYAKYKRFFVGKLVRILRPAQSGGYYVEFVRKADAEFLNANAGWNNKREYLLDGARFIETNETF